MTWLRRWQDDMEQTTHLLDRSHERAAVIWAT